MGAWRWRQSFTPKANEGTNCMGAKVLHWQYSSTRPLDLVNLFSNFQYQIYNGEVVQALQV